jgi:hypothetical protein
MKKTKLSIAAGILIFGLFIFMLLIGNADAVENPVKRIGDTGGVNVVKIQDGNVTCYTAKSTFGIGGTGISCLINE